MIDRATTGGLLWTHILGRAHDGTRESYRSCAQVQLQRLGNAKIEELDDDVVGVLRKEDVARLEIAVDDTLAMGPRCRSRDLKEDDRRFTWRDELLLAELIRE
jgi:hypothetical protein